MHNQNEITTDNQNQDVPEKLPDTTKPNSKKTIIIAAGVLTTIAIIIIAALLIFSKDKQSEKPTEPENMPQISVEVKKFRPELKVDYFEFMGPILKAHYANGDSDIIFASENLEILKILGINDQKMYVIAGAGSGLSKQLWSFDLASTQLLQSNTVSNLVESEGFALYGGCMSGTEIVLQLGIMNFKIFKYSTDALETSNAVSGTAIDDSGNVEAMACSNDTVYYYVGNREDKKYELLTYNITTNARGTINTLTNQSRIDHLLFINNHLALHATRYDENSIGHASSLWLSLPSGTYEKFGSGDPYELSEQPVFHIGDNKYIYLKFGESTSDTDRLVEWGGSRNLREIINMQAYHHSYALLPNGNLKVLQGRQLSPGDHSKFDFSWTYLDPQNDYKIIKEAPIPDYETQLNNYGVFWQK